MATWIETWGVTALVDCQHWYSCDRHTAWTLNMVTRALLLDGGEERSDAQLAAYLAARLPGGRVTSVDGPA